MLQRYAFLSRRPCLNFSSFLNEFRYASSNFYHGLNSNNIKSNIFSAYDVKLVCELAAIKNLVVSRPDNGNGAVMQGIVSDTDKILVVNEFLWKIALRFEVKLNRLAAKLNFAGVISEDIYRDVYARVSGLGILYGLPKVLKINFSKLFQMRQLFAAYNTPS